MPVGGAIRVAGTPDGRSTMAPKTMLVIALTTLTACSPEPDHNQSWATRPVIAAQICVLKTKVPDLLPTRWVRRGSAGGRSIPAGTTTAGELIFQGLEIFPQDMAGVIVFFNGKTQQAFLRRPRLSDKEWTPWIAPDQVSDDRDLWLKLVGDSRIGKGAPGPVSAYIRYKRGVYPELSRELDSFRHPEGRPTVPACPPLAVDSSL